MLARLAPKRDVMEPARTENRLAALGGFSVHVGEGKALRGTGRGLAPNEAEGRVSNSSVLEFRTSDGLLVGPDGRTAEETPCDPSEEMLMSGRTRRPCSSTALAVKYWLSPSSSVMVDCLDRRVRMEPPSFREWYLQPT